MIHNTNLINALRQLGYTHKREADRVHIWKLKGSTKRVEVRKHSWHDEEYARITLGLAGMNREEVERFICECRDPLARPAAGDISSLPGCCASIKESISLLSS